MAEIFGSQKDVEFVERIILIGNPLGHSISPRIHNACFRELGLQYKYELCAIVDGKLEGVIQQIRAGEFSGANVTIPYKQSVLKHLEFASDDARSTGAVNTIVRLDDGQLRGENTDVVGFMHPLRTHLEYLEGERVLVLGAGGSARAVVFSLLRSLKRVHINIAARRTFQAEQLVALFQQSRQSTVDVIEWGTRGAFVKESVLIINTTPVGMWPGSAKSLMHDAEFSVDQIVYDLVYNPMQTRLLQQAERAGATAISGLEMLIAQAAESFKMWTSRDMPLAIAGSAAIL